MKVVIFAGGWGTRLGQIAERVPKPMVSIGGEPILRHIMGLYARHGFKDFVVCLGVKGDVVRDYFEHFHTYARDFTINLGSGQKRFHTPYSALDWNVTLVETGLNTLKGARLKKVERFLDDDEHHFLTYGDGLADVDIPALLEFHKSHGKMLTVSGVRPPSRFGEIEERDGRVLSFSEKPVGTRHRINGGFMVFDRSLLGHLTTDDDCDFEYGVVGDLATRGEVMMYRHDGQWACVDHERDVHYLERLISEGRAFWRGPTATRPRPLVAVSGGES